MKKLAIAITLIIVGCYGTRDLTKEESAYKTKAMLQPTEFSLPKDKSQEVWGRIQVFIAQHCGMKIQTANDYSIATYDGNGLNGIFAYKATREPFADSMRIKISCDGGSAPRSVEEQNEHVCAYYAVTGESAPDVLIRK